LAFSAANVDRRSFLSFTDDKLVIAVGSSSSTHGVPGLEHAFQLKTVPDAQAIRRRIIDNLELASLPTTTAEMRKRLLSFVVCGGGPTGVEFAAELADMMSEDGISYVSFFSSPCPALARELFADASPQITPPSAQYPKLLRQEMSIHIIQSRDHILNTYSEKISEYAEAKFKREDINVVVNARVQKVTPDSVTVSVKDPKDPDAKPKILDIPSGFTLWSTGIAMNP
jgi:NADH dehydrogenase FAD-containing subunit